MDNYQNFLKKRHAGFHTDRHLLQQVVKEEIRKNIKHFQRLLIGEVNEVYDLTLDDSEHVIVRISHQRDPDFLQEEWALNHAREVGVPVPDILSVKHLETKVGLRSFCIMEKVAGFTLREVVETANTRDYTSYRRYINQAGEILSRIHLVSTERYGDLDARGKGEFISFEDFIIEKSKRLEDHINLARSTDFEPKLMERILRIFENNRKLYQLVPAVLCHGDFGPKHFMVQGGNIVGILDWGEADSNSAVMDFAWWDLLYADRFPTQWLQEGYATKDLFEGEFKTLLTILKLHRGIGLLYTYSQASFPHAVEKYKHLLTKTLAYFD